MKIPKLPNFEGKKVFMVVVLILIAMTAHSAFQGDLPRTIWRALMVLAALSYARYRKFF